MSDVKSFVISPLMAVDGQCVARGQGNKVVAARNNACYEWLKVNGYL